MIALGLLQGDTELVMQGFGLMTLRAGIAKVEQMKYPTRNGLIISPYELGYAEPTETDIDSRLTTNHHGYFTKKMYGRTAIRHTFRNLVDHVSPLVKEEHQELHDKYTPPQMPHLGLMVDVLDEYMALNGVINLVREKATNEIREMTESQWEQTRLNYKS